MRKYAAVGSLLLAFIIGCAATETYTCFVAPEFTEESLTAGGLAVFPVFAEGTSESVSDTRSYCRFASEELASVLRRKQQDIRIIGPTGVSYIFDKMDLVDDYSRLVENYRATGMFSPDISGKLSKSLGVKYFVLGRVRNMGSDNGDAETSLYVQIWSAGDAKMVFESGTEYKFVSRISSYDRALVEAIHKIVDGLIL